MSSRRRPPGANQPPPRSADTGRAPSRGAKSRPRGARSRATPSRRRAILFRAIPVAAALAVVAVAWWFVRGRDPIARGQDLHLAAFEAAFRERGMKVPPGGPREGVWGSRLLPTVRRPGVGWVHAPQEDPPRFRIDERGFQHWEPTAPPVLHVAVFGGSVAFGSCASSAERTWWAVMGRRLEKGDLPARVTVIAAGAWKTRQVVAALEDLAKDVELDVVVHLGGLNDLTNGAYATTFHGDPAPTLDGSPWTVEYHAGDYGARVKDYLAQVGRSAEIARGRGARMLVALQPALFEKRPRTRIEDELLRNTVAVYERDEAFPLSYGRMREGLEVLARAGGIDFLDASRAFEAESRTTFMDLWHFSDPGHEALGRMVAEAILRMRPIGEPDAGR